MVFNNSGYVPMRVNNLGSNLAKQPKSRNMPLNAPMIDRVHKAKPGCSACGKKVV
jgi:hypothetical protein